MTKHEQKLRCIRSELKTMNEIMQESYEIYGDARDGFRMLIDEFEICFNRSEKLISDVIKECYKH